MRRGLAVLVALAVMFAVTATPATGEPASSGSASAYGAAATGLLPISPTITAEVSQPPDEDVIVPPALLTVPLGGLALAGVVGVDAHAHRADDIVPALTGVAATASSDPVLLSNVNSHGLAKTAGAALVFTDPGGDPTTLAVRTLLAQLSTLAGGVLGADAIVAEAVAQCVNNQPVFETGYEVLLTGGLLGGLLDPVLQTTIDTLIETVLGPGTLLSAVITLEPGRVTPLADGVAIDGLVVRIPLLNQEIVISHAEAHMPGNCAVAPPTTVQPTGPDGIAPVGQVAAPQATLATTGSDVPYLPIGAVMVGSALLVGRIVRRRPSRSPVG